MKKLEIIYGIAAIFIIGIIIFCLASLDKWFNSATSSHTLIKPKDGIECVVISASDSTSVDCWKV